MLVEPDLDLAVLAAALRRDYGPAASAVRFLPLGETGWCYQVIDVHGDNLLGDRAGRVWMVDWDGAALAAPERPGRVRWPGIRAVPGRLPTHRRRLSRGPGPGRVYLLRRNLDDLVDWLRAVLGDDQPVEQRRADLDGVRWCLSRWEVLEARIEHTRGVLARRQRSR